MPRTCTICTHRERGEIDRLLLAGEPFRKIAKHTGTSVTSLFRHRSEHIAAAIILSKQAADVDYGDDLFGRMMSLTERALRILSQAEAANDPRLALSAIREVRGNMELQAKICSQMSQQVSSGPDACLRGQYQRAGAGPSEGEPDLSLLTNEEFAEIVRLMGLAEERYRRTQRPGLEKIVNLVAS